MWPLNMRDTPVTKLDEMPHRCISSRRIIHPHPGCRLRQLVINNHDGKALLIEARQILRGWSWKNSQQPRRQLRGKHPVDNLTAVLLEVCVVDAIQHQFVRGLREHLSHTAHQFGDERPGKRGDEHAYQLAAPTS